MNDSVYVSVTSFLALNLWLTGRAASGSGTVTASVDNCLRKAFTNDICNEGGSKFCGGAVLIGWVKCGQGEGKRFKNLKILPTSLVNDPRRHLARHFCLFHSFPLSSLDDLNGTDCSTSGCSTTHPLRSHP